MAFPDRCRARPVSYVCFVLGVAVREQMSVAQTSQEISVSTAAQIFLFKNDNPFPVKDLTIACIHSAQSGTKIDKNTRTIYEVIPAHGTKRVQKFNMGFIATQAVQSSCSVMDFQLP